MNNSDKWRMVFGIGLVSVLAALAVIIALGHVEEKTSFGLMPVVVALTSIGTTFANWAFSHGGRSNNDKDKE